MNLTRYFSTDRISRRCFTKGAKAVWLALVLGLTGGLLGGVTSVGAAFGVVHALVYICDDAAQTGQVEFIVGRARLFREQFVAPAATLLQESTQTQDCRLAAENEITLTLTSVEGGNELEAQTDIVGFARFDEGRELTGDYTLTENRNGVTSTPFTVDMNSYHLVTVVIYESEAGAQGTTQAYLLPSAGVGEMAAAVGPWTPIALAAAAMVFAVAAIRFRGPEPAFQLRTRTRRNQG